MGYSIKYFDFEAASEKDQFGGTMSWPYHPKKSSLQIVNYIYNVHGFRYVVYFNGKRNKYETLETKFRDDDICFGPQQFNDNTSLHFPSSFKTRSFGVALFN